MFGIIENTLGTLKSPKKVLTKIVEIPHLQVSKNNIIYFNPPPKYYQDLNFLKKIKLNFLQLLKIWKKIPEK
jgi:hypothetical protein